MSRPRIERVAGHIAHLAPEDLDHLDVQRTLHRVTLVGDRPVGPDGFVSELVSGAEFTAQREPAGTAAG